MSFNYWMALTAVVALVAALTFLKKVHHLHGVQHLEKGRRDVMRTILLGKFLAIPVAVLLLLGQGAFILNDLIRETSETVTVSWKIMSVFSLIPLLIAVTARLDLKTLKREIEIAQTRSRL